MNKSIDCVDLYHRCCHGDPLVQTPAFQELGELLMRVGLFRTQSKPQLYHQVEECAQEALLGIWQKLGTSGGPKTPAQFCAWASTIMIHKVIDMLRREGYLIRGQDKPPPSERETSLDDQSDEDNPDQEPADPKSSNLEENVTHQLQSDAMLEFILTTPILSDDERTVLFYGFILDWDDAELAILLGKAQPTIRVIRSRALHKLRNDDDFMALLRG